MSFDTLAPGYRAIELLLAGRLLQRCRTTFIAETHPSKNALLLGEGPGRFLTALLHFNPNVQITCIENSPAMIAQAQRQIHKSDLPRVTFQQTDALTWQPPHAHFDLIATHFFLDCFRPDQLRQLIPKIASASTSNARWLLTDFRQPAQGWQGHRARAIHILMYSFFRFVTHIPANRLTPPDPFLQQNGFQLSARHLANFGLIHSDLWLRAS